MTLQVKNKSRSFWAFAVALISVAIWGETFVSSKIVLDAGLRPADLFFFRFALAYVGIWFLSFMRPSCRRLMCGNWMDELLMLLLGLSGGSLYFLSENTALSYSTASNVAIILSSTPLVTAFVMSMFYRSERMDRSQIAGSFIALAGLALIIFNGEVVLKLNPRGDLMAFGGTVSWAVYSLVIKRVSDRYDAVIVTRKVFGYGLLTIVPYFMVYGWPVIDTAVICRPEVWINLVYLGLVASLGCFLSWNWAISVLGPVSTTNLLYLQPFFTMLVGYAVLGEQITWMAVAGVLVLIAGMSLVISRKILIFEGFTYKIFSKWQTKR